MLKTIMIRALSIAVALMALLAATVPGSADECKKYEHTVPESMKVLTGEEIRAALTGNTVDGWTSGYRFYFAANGNLTTETRERRIHGEWKVCGNVLVMNPQQFGGRTLERLLIAPEPGQLFLHELDGKLVTRWKIIKGQDF